MRDRKHRIRRSTGVVVSLFRRLAVLTLMSLALSLPLSNRVQASQGDLDPTFGTDGKVTSDLFPGNDVAFALGVQPDGKLIVAGRTENSVTGFDFALARYDTNGNLDSNFGA